MSRSSTNSVVVHAQARPREIKTLAAAAVSASRAIDLRALKAKLRHA